MRLLGDGAPSNGAGDARVLPHNLDSEATVLGGILLRNAALAEVPDLQAEDFYDPRHREVFSAMRTLGERLVPLDPVSVAEELGRVGKLAAVGGKGFLSGLLADVATADNIRHHAKVIRDKARAVRVIQVASEIAARGLRGDYGDEDDFVSVARSEIASIAQVDSSSGFASVGASVDGERDAREKLVARKISYPCQFLTDFLYGILPHDLVLLGAESGLGKTTMATMIAEDTVLGGKRADYFALEAEPLEVTRRIKYRRILHHLDHTIPDDHPHRAVLLSATYRRWYTGQLDAILPRQVEREIDAGIRDDFRDLHAVYRGKNFSTRDLTARMRAEADLVVVDHLHYVDADDQRATENAAQRMLIKALRDQALLLGVPVVVVAHLRKKVSREVRVVPALDDFMGSSDIGKTVTQAIVLARAEDVQPPTRDGVQQPHLWPTFAAVRKDRMDGARPQVAAMLYNARTGRYERNYMLGRIAPSGDKWNELALRDYPSWVSPYARPWAKSEGAAERPEGGSR